MIVGLLVAVAGCGGSADDATPEEVLAAGGSLASVVVGETTYEFEATCFDAGAGSVVVVGTGTDPRVDDGVATHLLVKAFLGESYIGVTVGDAEPEGESATTAPADDLEIYEAALDQTLDLLLEEDTIAADDIAFVRGLPLDALPTESSTGAAGESAGAGSLLVRCGSFEKGVPEEFDR
jgi:hypothetical protein